MSSDAPHSRKSRLTVPAGADPLAGGRASAPFPSASGSSAAAMPVWQYLTRLTDVRQMDVQSALDQMKTLLSSRPQVVYKTAYYRKQTKNHWARDDPAFVALQGLFLLIASVAYSVAFRITLSGAISFILYTVVWVSHDIDSNFGWLVRPWGAFSHYFYLLLQNWIGLGCILATLCREIANRHLTAQTSSTHVRQQVEWLYAFDIHCNSFFPVFVLLCKLFFINV